MWAHWRRKVYWEAATAGSDMPDNSEHNGEDLMPRVLAKTFTSSTDELKAFVVSIQ